MPLVPVPIGPYSDVAASAFLRSSLLRGRELPKLFALRLPEQYGKAEKCEVRGSAGLQRLKPKY